MNIAPLGQHLRVAILSSPSRALHFPEACTWATVQTFPVLADLSATVAEAAAFRPDVCVIAEPQAMSAEGLSRLPGLKIGLLLGPLLSPAEVRCVARLARGVLGEGGIAWFTYFEHPAPPDIASSLPLLMTLPPPVDTGRCLAAPRLDARGVLVPAWAAPPVAILEQLRALAPVEVIPCEADPASWTRWVDGHGVLVYWTTASLGRIDPLPLLALASGLLLVANREFPAGWGIEVEDEYLHRPDPEAAVLAVEDFLRTSPAASPVRVRAWQKMRECLAASEVLHRLVHDALLFSDPAAALARLRDQRAPADAQARSPRGGRLSLVASGPRTAADE